MEQTPNWLGATIFWLYIAGALFFTALVIYTIINMPQSKENVLARFDTKSEQRLFALLAILSFIVLSANMLHVLINSFTTWTREHSTDSPTTNIFSTIGTWSLSSTLFRDFVDALLYDRARMAWTAAALSPTFGCCLYMGLEGHRREVPRLWAFFCLAQILPISFSQNLFALAILRVRPPPKPTIPIQLLFLFGQIGMYFGFSGIVFALSEKPESLMHMVLSTRLLLLLPYCFADTAFFVKPWVKMNPARLLDFAACIGLLLLPGIRVYTAVVDQGNVQPFWPSLFSHPAVTTLGCDFILSVISVLCMRLVESKRSKVKPDLEWKPTWQHGKESPFPLHGGFI